MNADNPRIVFCTTCKGRTQHLERTIVKNIEDNADYDNCVFVVLDYGSPDHLREFLESLPYFKNGKLVVYGYYDWKGAFRMSHAKNMAHRCGILEGGDALVNMDADNYAAPGFASWIAEQYRKHGLENTFLWSNAKSVIGRARQGLAGRTVISTNLFLKLGGYDEKYADWAPEDEDFKSRAKRLLGNQGIRIEDQFLYVIPHKDGLRFKEYPHAKPDPEKEARSLREIRESDNTVVNFGKFGIGNVYRNFSKVRIPLGPVPTRIFGIGMQKTATTSLNEAFRILGIDSGHWTGPWWAKRIWEEMSAYGRSITLEKHYALSDFPFTIMFRQLDKAYPGSKFILTLRSEQSWIESVRKHWETNRVKFDWDHDCFSHKMHHLVYGRKNFDSEIFLNRYRSHNAEVLEYFRNRPDDLLVMDMGKNAGWHELCLFLHYPIPKVPYPKAFVSN